MPTTLGKRKSNSDGREWLGKSGVFVIPILVATSLVVLAINNPLVSVWISDAARAEFVGATSPSDFDSVPVPKPRVLHAAK